MKRLITLTTDFGLLDEYVGVMKGVILSRLPEARLVDLTHQIPPQDVARAAYLLEAAVPYFPAGTLHLLVVDPGVGTERRIIAVQAGDQLFLAPDNGVLTLPIRRLEAAYQVDCPELYLQPVSRTFHGRDIFAPVAAALAGGFPPADLGRRLAREELTLLSFGEARADPARRTMSGQVVSIDYFGNLLTNIHQETYRAVFPQCAPAQGAVRIKDQIVELHPSYGSVAPGALLALFGSRGYLEIAVNQGHAARLLDVACHDPVEVISRPGEPPA